MKMTKKLAKIKAKDMIKIKKYKISANFIVLDNGERESRSKHFWQILGGACVTESRK